MTESNNSIAVRLASALNVNRTTLLRYLDKGMPSNEEGARQWILAYKTNKSKTRAPKASTTAYRFMREMIRRDLERQEKASNSFLQDAQEAT